MSNLDAARRRMAARLLERGVSPRTVDAFARVRREDLVPRFWTAAGEHRASDEPRLLYDPDRAVAVNVVPDAPGRTTSTASAPALLAAQADHLALEPGMSVLEIGTGPGYFAAILAELVGPEGRVVTVEIDPEIGAVARDRLGERAVVVVGDGDAGAPAHAPFDRVVASVGCTDVAAAWLAQLRPDGRALVPLLHGGVHPVVDVGPDGAGRIVMRSGYVAVQGRQSASSPWPHALAGVEPEAWETFTVGAASEWDVALWIALNDRRAGRMAGLNDGAGSSAHLDVRRGAVGWGGPAGAALAVELRTHVAAWEAAGRPSVEAFEHRFVPRSERASGRWVVDRVDHRQLVG